MSQLTFLPLSWQLGNETWADAHHWAALIDLYDELSHGSYPLDWNQDFELFLGPDSTNEHHDKFLPTDIFK